jgi:MoaA/NifB/PqqE/SkfB family radical SAM enzyme
MAASHGWALVDAERKRDIIAAICAGEAPRGPLHVELDLTDRCNVACYFCNQQDVRTSQQLPLERIASLLDELVAGGLRSVRLSGGGDPLFHKQILTVLDELTARGVVIDNLTTNGALLNPEVARRLVANGCREVIFSLNAADAADYHRMMAVKPGTFDKVCENIRHLAAARGAARLPLLVVQFLLDRENVDRIPEMYRLGASLHADRLTISPVLEIPRERIEHDRLLGPGDGERIRAHLEQILVWDRGAEKDGQCFFGFYTATIRGNGDLYPCCMLMHPDYKPLGNALQGSFADHWRGAAFTRLRGEMRELLLRGGRMFFRPKRFRTLGRQCVEAHQCGLKNMYFRQDEEFYAELGRALDAKRAAEVRWLGSPRQLARAAEVLAFRVYHGLRVRAGALVARAVHR